jgi:hypothetical protein
MTIEEAKKIFEDWKNFIEIADKLSKVLKNEWDMTLRF